VDSVGVTERWGGARKHVADGERESSLQCSHDREQVDEEADVCKACVANTEACEINFV